MSKLARAIAEPLFTLWDLMRGSTHADDAPSPPNDITQRPPARQATSAAAPPARAQAPRQAAQHSSNAAPASTSRSRSGATRTSATARYDRMTRELLTQYRIRVRKWRTTSSGVAWEVYYADGSIARLIEAPRPRGPMSAAVFLHEVGHHAIGFNRYKPRCLEEYHAWMWALGEMERRGLNITEAVRTRIFRSLRYAVAKAQRRGIKQIPDELVAYTPGPRALTPGVEQSAARDRRAGKTAGAGRRRRA